MNAPAKHKLAVLRRRKDFLSIAQSGKKWVAPALILQACPAPPSPSIEIRYGLTASGKIGNAVKRNRARRRMRALAAEMLPLHAKTGLDYVLIARATTTKCSFDGLRQDLATALLKLGAWRD